MKRLTVVLALALVAGCSGGEGAGPQASETGAAVAATDSASAASTETPMTADRCIEDNKGLGTGTRGENTKDCMITACDKGDKKSCDMVKSFGGVDAENEPPPEETFDE